MAESPRRSASGGRKGTAGTPTRPLTVTLSAENARTAPGQLQTRARPPAAPYGPSTVARWPIPAACST
jgi:hypothetical protein